MASEGELSRTPIWQDAPELTQKFWDVLRILSNIQTHAQSADQGRAARDAYYALNWLLQGEQVREIVRLELPPYTPSYSQETPDGE